MIRSGFVNLSHINSRKTEIVWEEDDLYDLLIRRIQESSDLLKSLDVSNGSTEEIFGSLFPEKVDGGSRKPSTWVWMMGRIRDGNDVRPPRNLIDLVQKAQSEQLRREDRARSEYVPGTAVIGSDAIKKGLARLSNQRVEDTLLAEAGEFANLIEAFRGGKAEHNTATLETVLDLHGTELAKAIDVLKDLGFLEEVGTSYKVPMLYRDGLGITQGKAFASDSSEDDED